MVAKDEWVATAVIQIQVDGRLIAIDRDDPCAEYSAVRRLRSSCVATADSRPGRAERVLVEVRRQHGGHSEHALVGGELIVGVGDETLVELSVADTYDVQLSKREGLTPCRSRLGRQHLIPGLPSEFAPRTLRGFVDGRCSTGLPPGRLTIDRAAFDEVDSAAPIFELAARMLRCTLAVMLQDGDVEAEAYALVQSW